MGYIYLALSIVLEMLGTICMKLSDGFSNKLFAAVIAKIFFQESISTPGLIGIAFIVVGVVLCNFFGENH